MHFQSVSAQQAYMCNYPMRSCLGFRTAIARLFQPQAYCQAHHLIVRNLKTINEIDEQKKTRKKLRKPLTQKVLRQEASQKWLSSLSSGECDMTEGVKAEELATGLELCDSADDLLQSEEVANGNGAANAWVLGIDPDNGGALAVLRPGDSAAQVYDAPTVQVCIGKRFRRRLDTRSIVSLLCGLGVPKGSSAYIEQAIPFPRDGKQGWWSNGFGYGLWIGILVSFGFSVIPIPSVVWKKHFDLAGKTTCKPRSVQAYITKQMKEKHYVDYRMCILKTCTETSRFLSSCETNPQDDSRFIACNLFPYLSPQLKRKKDHGRAEALLLAKYGREVMKTSNR